MQTIDKKYRSIKMVQWILMAVLAINSLVSWGDIERPLEFPSEVTSGFVSDLSFLSETNVYSPISEYSNSNSPVDLLLSPLFDWNYIGCYNQKINAKFTQLKAQSLSINKPFFFYCVRMLPLAAEDPPIHLFFS